MVGAAGAEPVCWEGEPVVPEWEPLAPPSSPTRESGDGGAACSLTFVAARAAESGSRARSAIARARNSVTVPVEDSCACWRKSASSLLEAPARNVLGAGPSEEPSGMRVFATRPGPSGGNLARGRNSQDSVRPNAKILPGGGGAAPLPVPLPTQRPAWPAGCASCHSVPAQCSTTSSRA